MALGNRVRTANGYEIGPDADLYEANLRHANLVGANLEGAELEFADLTGADLTGANLKGAKLVGAILHTANLTGAELEGANLTGANFLYARVDVEHVPFIEKSFQKTIAALRVNSGNSWTTYDYALELRDKGGRSENPSGRKTDYALGRVKNPRQPIQLPALKAAHKHFEKLIVQEFGNNGPDDDDEDAMVDYQVATDALISLDTIIHMIIDREPQRKVDSAIKSFYSSGEADSAAVYIDIEKVLPRP